MADATPSDDEAPDGKLIDFVSGALIPAKPEEMLAVQPFARQLVEDTDIPRLICAQGRSGTLRPVPRTSPRATQSTLPSSRGSSIATRISSWSLSARSLTGATDAINWRTTFACHGPALACGRTGTSGSSFASVKPKARSRLRRSPTFRVVASTWRTSACFSGRTSAQRTT